MSDVTDAAHEEGGPGDGPTARRGATLARCGSALVLLTLVAVAAFGASPVLAAGTVADGLTAGDAGSVPVLTTSTGPTASCTVSDTTVVVGESVTIDASASKNADDYQYDKYGTGDWGGYTSQSSTTVSYGESGTYEPRVKVWSYDGGEQSDTATCGSVTVTDPTPTPTPTPAPSPTARCTVSDTSVQIGESVTLDASASENADDYQYDKYGTGDWGGYTSQSSTTVTYSEAGTYEPRVKVWSYDGGEQSDTATCGSVSVTESTPTPTPTPAPSPTARCSVSDTSVQIGESVTLDASASENADDYQYDEYGDADWGGYTSQSSITVTYEESGTYEPRVKVWSYDGGEQSDTATCGSVTVTESTPTATPTPTGGPTALCSVSDTEVSVDESVVLDASDSDGAVQYEFARSSDDSFRDPQSTGLSTVRYQRPGTYSPRVRVTGDAGGTDTATCGSISVTEAENTPTETRTATDTATATSTPVPTATTTGTATRSPTAAPTPTASPTATGVPTSSTTTERASLTDSPRSRTATAVPTGNDSGTNGTEADGGGSADTGGSANGTTTDHPTPSAATGDPGTRTTSESGPGFGVIAAILAVTMAVARRRDTG